MLPLLPGPHMHTTYVEALEPSESRTSHVLPLSRQGALCPPLKPSPAPRSVSPLSLPTPLGRAEKEVAAAFQGLAC